MLVDSIPGAPVGLNWDVRRWDGQRYYSSDPNGELDWLDVHHVVRGATGSMLGIAHLDRSGGGHIQVRADARQCESELLDWLGSRDPRPDVVALEDDTMRQELLRQRGYAPTQWYGVYRLRRFGTQPLDPPRLAEGYRMRSVDSEHTTTRPKSRLS